MLVGWLVLTWEKGDDGVLCTSHFWSVEWGQVIVFTDFDYIQIYFTEHNINIAWIEKHLIQVWDSSEYQKTFVFMYNIYIYIRVLYFFTGSDT